MTRQQLRCLSCNGVTFETIFADVHSANAHDYSIVQCRNCSIAFVFENEGEVVDYADYGDHITREGDSYYNARGTHLSFSKRILFHFLKRKFGMSASILDFGSGAGFFMKSCESFGFAHVWGLEPSAKLRNVATTKLGIPTDRVVEHLARLDGQFDVIAMLDVIEHLPVENINDILRDLTGRLKPGGILFGTTPNLGSLNIKISGQRDPVIAPPQHSVYFSSKSLDAFLRQHGLRRKLLFGTGLSTNSFFRDEKFSPSWVERARGWQRVAAIGIKAAFAAAGVLLTPFGAGYGLYFIYEKPKRPLPRGLHAHPGKR